MLGTQVEALRKPFLDAVMDLARPMQTTEGIVSPYEMQWVVAHTAA